MKRLLLLSLLLALSISGTWTITATVNDNNTVTYTDGTTSWTVTEPCDGGTAAPWNRFTGISRNLD
jgi:hypothetical protein